MGHCVNGEIDNMDRGMEMGNRKWIAGIVTAVLMGMAAGCSSRPAVEESVQTSAERTEAPSAEEQIVGDRAFSGSGKGDKGRTSGRRQTDCGNDGYPLPG